MNTLFASQAKSLTCFALRLFRSIACGISIGVIVGFLTMLLGLLVVSIFPHVSIDVIVGAMLGTAIWGGVITSLKEFYSKQNVNE